MKIVDSSYDYNVRVVLDGLPQGFRTKDLIPYEFLIPNDQVISSFSEYFDTEMEFQFSNDENEPEFENDNDCWGKLQSLGYPKLQELMHIDRELVLEIIWEIGMLPFVSLSVGTHQEDHAKFTFVIPIVRSAICKTDAFCVSGVGYLLYPIRRRRRNNGFEKVSRETFASHKV